ncbi:TIGR02099 family protein [Pseudidiomarina indica]|uniref:TIGR02099 family protein n=1 Tax=Pseudidiomarina indica TaxID=1159017 RepID=A0A1G6CJC4_9GAMM|nr:YhdP family protein [Pseudidiomarina indica]SDB32872.1 TIGR02099 family protein [Pseudidiomarina indica]
MALRNAVRWLWRSLLYTLATALVLFALLLSALRYLLPQLPDVTEHVEQFLANQYALDVQLAQISADWSRSGPELILHQFVLLTDDEQATRVEIDEARVVIDFWGSARAFNVQLAQVQLNGMRLHYDLRDSYGKSSSQPLQLSTNLGNLLLDQLDNIEVRESSVELVNLMGVMRTIDIQELRWANQGQRHYGVGKLAFSEVTENTLDVMIDMHGSELHALSGQVYVAANQLDITPWVQQQIIDTQIQAATFNYNMWLNFEQNQFTDGLLQLGEQKLQWRVGEQRHQLRIPHGELKLRPYADGWRVNSNPLTIEHNDRSWVLPTFSWEDTPTTTAMSLEGMPLAPLVELLNLLGSQGAKVVEQFSERDTQGVLDLAYYHHVEQGARWYAAGENLSWGEFAGVPGLSNVNLKVHGRDQQMVWQLYGTDAAFRSDALDEDDAWPIDQLTVAGTFSWSADSWRLQIAPDSEIRLPGLPIGVAATITPSSESVHIDALARSLNEVPISADVLRRHLPIVMGDSLHDYLSMAIQDGYATDLAMVWRGALEDFPYHNNEGLFEARARISGLLYKFQPDWRPVYDANAIVNFRNERMHITATDGLIGLIDVARADVVIPDLVAGDDARLDITASIAGNANELKPVFDDSPLAGSLGGTLAEVQLSGPVTGYLELMIPLTNSPDVVAKGYADLAGAEIYVRSLKETFTQVDGRIHYHNDVITAPTLTMNWRDFPLAAELSTQQREQDYFVAMQVDGRWQLDEFAPLLMGTMPWQADFNLSLPNEGGYSFRWYQSASLNDVSAHLPAPLGKEQGVAQELELTVSGDPDSVLVNAEIGEYGLLELQLNGDLSELQSGYARIGQLQQPTLGLNRGRHAPLFNVEIGLETGVIDDWLAVMTQLNRWLPEGAGESDVARVLRPDLIQFESQQLRWLDMPFDGVQIVAHPEQDDWQLRVEAEQVLADVYWRQKNAEQAAQIQIDAEYIDIPRIEWQQHDSAAVAAEDATPTWLPSNFAGLPELLLDCKRCRYDHYELGEVSIHLRGEEHQLELAKLTAHYRGHQLDAKGHWLLETAEQYPQTRLFGRFESSNFGEFLDSYDITSMVRDSSATIDFDLHYMAAPHQLELDTLNGSVTWALGQGYLNDVSDRGARLFSLLSLDSILRKLRFDFRDVFANGLFYTNFSGEFEVADGVVMTQNTQLNGSAGDMEVKGSANLTTRELAYDLQFVPKVTSSLPVIFAWMINPPSGLAALVIDRMLHDAKVISRLEYRISGTMDDPVIEEVARDSRAAPIPAEELNHVESDNPAGAIDRPATHQ